MALAARPYLRGARLRFFEHDPGLIRLRRAGRIVLGGLVALIPALIVSALLGVARTPPGTRPVFDLTLVLPVLIFSVLLSANIAGADTRQRQLGMFRNFAAGVLIAVPASLVAEGSFAYGAGFAAAAALGLYLRRFGPSWKGLASLVLFVFVLVPRLEITPSLLPRFWAALAVAFLSSFYVSFRVLPVRLVRALLDCLARFIAAVSSSAALIRSGQGFRFGDGTMERPRREMNISLALWHEIAAGVLPPKDPAWSILDGIADGQYRLGNLLRIAGGSLADLAAGPPETVRRAGEILGELESLLESARRGLVLEGKIDFGLDRFRERVREFREEWEAGREPISAVDIQIGRFAVAMERSGAVLESISNRARRLAGREG